MLVQLTIKPGAGRLSYWGEVVVAVNGEGYWTVHRPDSPVAAEYVRDYLNARYGGHVLSVRGGTVADLGNRALEDFSSEELGE